MLAHATVRFTTQTGEHSLAAAVASDEADRRQGLLGAGPGYDGVLVLSFEPPWRAAITMDGMRIPLDVVFVLPTGEVDSLVEHAMPDSGVYYPTAGIAGWAVELPVGTIRRLRIGRGSSFVLAG